VWSNNSTEYGTVQHRIVHYCTSKDESKLPALTARSPSNSGLLLDRTRLREGVEVEEKRGEEDNGLLDNEWSVIAAIHSHRTLLHYTSNFLPNILYCTPIHSILLYCTLIYSTVLYSMYSIFHIPSLTRLLVPPQSSCIPPLG
jgi:hypothetical protein